MRDPNDSGELAWLCEETAELEPPDAFDAIAVDWQLGDRLDEWRTGALVPRGPAAKRRRPQQPPPPADSDSSRVSSPQRLAGGG